MKPGIIYIACLLLALWPAVTQAQFSIKGTIKNMPDGQVTLVYYTAKGRTTDSAKLSAGQFTLTGRLPESDKVILLFKPGRQRIDFYLENREITITGNADSIAQVVIKGSPLQDQYQEYVTAFKNLKAVSDPLYAAYAKAQKETDTALTMRLQTVVLNFAKVVEQFDVQYIATHPSSSISLERLYGLLTRQDYPVVNRLYNNLDTALQHTAMGKRTAGLLATMKKIAIGEPAAAFTQKDAQGNTVQLADYKGKYLLLDFWASWCKPCRAENPNLLKAYQLYKEKGLNILGVSLDQDKEKWQAAIAEDQLPWKHVSDLKGGNNAAANDYGVITIPANVLIDPNGIIIARNLRGETLSLALEKLIKPVL